jgi:hypothetical protein
VSRAERILTSVAVWAAAAGLALSACSGGGRVPGDSPATPGPAVTSSSPSPSPTPSPEPTPLAVSDFEAGVKVLDKECFGSAGGLIEYKLTLGVTDEVRAKLAADGRRYDVTVQVTGDEDGPQVATLEVEPDASFLGERENASTPRCNTKLTAKVTEVDMRLY